MQLKCELIFLYLAASFGSFYADIMSPGRSTKLSSAAPPEKHASHGMLAPSLGVSSSTTDRAWTAMSPIGILKISHIQWLTSPMRPPSCPPPRLSARLVRLFNHHIEVGLRADMFRSVSRKPKSMERLRAKAKRSVQRVRDAVRLLHTLRWS